MKMIDSMAQSQMQLEMVPRGHSYDAVCSVIKAELEKPDSEIRQLIMSIVNKNENNESDTPETPETK